MENLRVSPAAIAAIVGTKNATRKTEFDARLHQLDYIDPQIRRNIQNGDENASIATIAVAKSVSTRSSFDELFKTDDAITVGISSIPEAMPPKGEGFLCTHMQLQFAIADGVDKEDVTMADFGLIHNYMRNGNILITQNGSVVLAEQLMEQFYVADNYVAIGDTNPAAGTPATYTMKGIGNVGLIPLDTPKWIKQQERIEARLDFTAPLPLNSAIRLVLYGVKNVKA